MAWMRPPASCPQPCGSLHSNFPQPAERTQGTAPTSPRPVPAGGSKTSHIHRMLPAPEPLLTPCASGRCRVVGAHGRPHLGTSTRTFKTKTTRVWGHVCQDLRPENLHQQRRGAASPLLFGEKGGTHGGSIARHRCAPPGATGHRVAHGPALHSAAEHHTALLGTPRAGGGHHPAHPNPVPAPSPCPPARPRRGPRTLCRQRRIVLGARSPCPADGRYNKAACCGQANYLSNYDLPLNHMIFLQSCGQLKPG